MTDEQILILVVLVAVVLLLLFLAAGLVLAFTVFVLALPPLLSILMFILFPPTLIVFLVGLAFMAIGVRRESGGRGSGDNKELEKEKARRRALGYDE